MDEKIITENTAGAFLRKDDKFLLMKRSPNRLHAPNLWSCIGGHLEAYELNDPLGACLREIKEESGINRENIFNLKLRYLIIRQYKNIIRQSYVYFGDTNTDEFINTDEGTLHWIPKDELLNREYTKTYMQMVRHYLYTPDPENRLIIGAAGKNKNELKMNWSVLEDFE